MDAPKEAPNEAPKETPNNAPRKAPTKAPNNVANQAPHKAPNMAPNTGRNNVWSLEKQVVGSSAVRLEREDSLKLLIGGVEAAEALRDILEVHLLSIRGLALRV